MILPGRDERPFVGFEHAFHTCDVVVFELRHAPQFFPAAA